MIREKISRLLDIQGKYLKQLALYTAVVLLIFSIAIPIIGQKLNQKQEDIPAQNVTEYRQETNSQNLERGISFSDYLIEERELSEKEEIPAQKNNMPGNSSIPEVGDKTVAKPVLQEADINQIIWPLRGNITQEVGLGYSKTFSDYRYHNGIDIQAARGTEVVASLPGKIAAVESSRGEAKKVSIDHGNGWLSIYAHLEEVYLKKDDTVKAGQAVGHVGQAGVNEVLEGPHLHYTLLKNGQVVNPLDYFPK